MISLLTHSSGLVNQIFFQRATGKSANAVMSAAAPRDAKPAASTNPQTRITGLLLAEIGFLWSIVNAAECYQVSRYLPKPLGKHDPSFPTNFRHVPAGLGKRTLCVFHEADANANMVDNAVRRSPNILISRPDAARKNDSDSSVLLVRLFMRRDVQLSNLSPAGTPSALV